MMKTFNMGLGMMGVIAEKDLLLLEKTAKALKEEIYIVGKIGKGTGLVHVG